jgi:spore maturation protein CgeB
MDGVIYCSDENEIIEKTNKLTSDDYHNKKTAIEHNFELAKHYANFNSRLVKILDEIIKINNI